MSHPDRWQHLERLFHAALVRDEGERAPFLREACRGDEPLRRDVESLLAFEIEAQAFMQASAFEVAPSLIQPQTARLVGQRLGPYEIGALLGSGGMGDVYRARDTTLVRDVAIKILPDIFTVDANRRARFEREARLLAALNHPHIGAIYGFEQREGIHALVLELVEGHTLAERLRAGPLPVREATTIARQIAEALDAAHEKGIVHRDLKPSNVTITPDGVVKVLDFGLAKADVEESARDVTASPAVTADDTREGLILGTAAYMSPEQARGRRVDKRADIWAFGCVLWEMLTGRAAFAGETVSHTIAAILDAEPAWDFLPPDTPANVLRLLRRCLEKDPRRRLRDIGDAQSELDEQAAGLVSPPKTRWRAAAAWSAAVCVLGALAVAGYAISRAPAPRLGVARFHVRLPGEGAARDVALSADGRRLAFVALGADSQRRVWVRSTDSLEAQALEGSEGASFPFWSPDGRFIAFFAQGQLRKIAAGGGAPHVLCDAANGKGGTWSRAGTILFTPVADSGLYEVSANGGKPRPVTTPREGQNGHRFPQFLPDGRHFLFLAQTGRGTPSGIHVGSLDSPETVLVLETVVRAQYAPPGYLLFIRDNALMAQAFDPGAVRLSGDVMSIAEDISNDPGGGNTDFAVSEGVLAYLEHERNLGELVWVDRAGQPLGNAAPLADYIHPWLSPDSNRAVVEIVDPDTQAHSVWMLDLVRGSRSQFVAGPAQSHFPVWSPDGRTILFSSDRSGPWSLFARPSASAGADDELLSSTTTSHAVDWSRDGRFILYETVHSSTRWDIWALPMAPRGRPFAVATSARNERQAQLSPDGRWVAYASDDNGREDVWVQAFPEAQEKWAISTAGGSQPQWRRDGQELFYISRDLKLMAVDVNGAASSFASGVPRTLFPLRLGDNLSVRNNFMPAADGKRFLINTSFTGSGTNSLAVVLDWAAVLRTR